MSGKVYVVQFQEEELDLMWQVYCVVDDEETAKKLAEDLMGKEEVFMAGYEKVPFYCE